MYKTYDTLSKIQLCGIYLHAEKVNLEMALEMQTYYQKVQFPSEIKEYSPYLFMLGYSQRKRKQEFKDLESKGIFEKEDQDYELWKELCLQLERLFKHENIGAYFYKNKATSPMEKFIFSSVDVRRNFPHHIIPYLIDDLCDFENKYGYSVKPEGITIETIQQRLKDLKVSEYVMFGTNSGTKITPLALHSRLLTYKLSFLLRIDRLLCDPTVLRIDDITLKTDEHKFIYNYLEFFDLLEYKKSNPGSTTKPQQVIEKRLEGFPKERNPIEYMLLLEIKSEIDRFAFKLKMHNRRIKKYKGKKV